jgi:hypothetical protein
MMHLKNLLESREYCEKIRPGDADFADYNYIVSAAANEPTPFNVLHLKGLVETTLTLNKISRNSLDA